MRVTLQIRTAYGVEIGSDPTLVTVMRDCVYGEGPNDEAAERIYRAVRYLNEALAADLAIIASIDNTPPHDNPAA